MQEESLKQCSKCKEYKPIDHFHKRTISARYKDGRDSHCPSCKNEAHKNWSRANKEKINENARQFKAKNPDKIKEWSRSYLQNNKNSINERKRKALLKKLYNLTHEEYNSMLVAQNNRCKICELEFVKTPMTDHCHSTGKVRGLLCNKCNWLLGNANDNPAILLKAIDYLNSAQTP